jgi:hypothetical protein
MRTTDFPQNQSLLNSILNAVSGYPEKVKPQVISVAQTHPGYFFNS